MRFEEALGHLREFLWGLQRYRSITMENLGPGSKSAAADLWPWVFGEKCPLPTLAKIIDDAEEAGILAPLDYYNMMVILHRFIPEVKVVISALRGAHTMPEGAPSLDILKGWDQPTT